MWRRFVVVGLSEVLLLGSIGEMTRRKYEVKEEGQDIEDEMEVF